MPKTFMRIWRSINKELTTVALLAMLIFMWIGEQFWGYPVKEYMFIGILTALLAKLGVNGIAQATVAVRKKLNLEPEKEDEK